MKSNAYSPALFEQLPIVGILRGFSRDRLEMIVRAVIEGGLTNLEVTMNSPNAAEQIIAAREMAGTALNIGAGTVTSLALLDEALEAGAGYIVTPALIPAVVKRCVELKVPVFPGAFTPTEIFQAWELGATMVKVFPAEVLGPAFFRAVRGPMPQIKLMVTGGVDLKTIGEYRLAGAKAFGIGGPLFDTKRIMDGDCSWLPDRCRAFIEAYKAAGA